MDPNHNTGPNGFTLPNVAPQSPQEAGIPVQPNPNMTASPESAINSHAEAAPSAGAPAAAAPAWLPPTVPVQTGGAPGAAATQASAGVATPATADDGDVIEKEWVEKAKQIVERTRQDPHLQTKEMHKFKAEYMKKRYNKIIEAVEE